MSKTVAKVEEYQLPDGEVTSDTDRMIRSWRKLKRPLEKVFGEQCFGFDPHLSFTGSLRLSAPHAIRLYEAITGKKYSSK